MQASHSQLTSALDLSVDRLGLNRTSRKSSFTSVSIRILLVGGRTCKDHASTTFFMSFSEQWVTTADSPDTGDDPFETG
jgi:hypothetical protein